MTKNDALAVMEALDEVMHWSQEEYEKGVREAEADGVEPLANPRVFDVRLDAVSSPQDFERDYRVRVTPSGASQGIERTHWQLVFDAAAKVDCSAYIQNDGIELS